MTSVKGQRWAHYLVKGCGTEAACRRHQRRGETPDRACLDAAAQAKRVRKADREARNQRLDRATTTELLTEVIAVLAGLLRGEDT